MARKQQDNAPAPAAQPAYEVGKGEKDRWWEVRDPQGELVWVTVYNRGAVEVMRRLAARPRNERSSRCDIRRGCCAVLLML